MRRRVSARISPTAFTWPSLPARPTCMAAAATSTMRPRRSTRERSAPRAASSQGAGPSPACLGLGPALGGQAEDPAALRLVRGDQSLVLEGLEGRVDRAGAGPPDAPAALGQLGDDLVAVHRLLGQEGEDGGADVAPSPFGPRPNIEPPNPGPKPPCRPRPRPRPRPPPRPRVAPKLRSPRSGAPARTGTRAGVVVDPVTLPVVCVVGVHVVTPYRSWTPAAAGRLWAVRGIRTALV